MGERKEFDDAELQRRATLAAKMFNYPPTQFYLIVKGNKELESAIMEFDEMFYATNTERLKEIDGEQGFERANKIAKLKKTVLNKSFEELTAMRKEMEDLRFK